MENSHRTTCETYAFAAREAIQAQMREKFDNDITMFIYEVTQYEINHQNQRKYIVYLDYEWSVDYREHTCSSYGQSAIFNKLKLLENLPDEHFSPEQKLSFRRQLAQALVAGYDQKPETANSLLDTAKAFYDDCLNRTIIQQYRRGGAIYIAILWVLGFICMLPSVSKYCYKFIQADSFQVSLGAVTGGFLAIYTTANRMVGYTHKLQILTWCLPALRLFFAIVCGNTAFAIFSCKCITPKIVQLLLEECYGAFILGAIVGFSEFFIPSVLENFGNFLQTTIMHFSTSLHKFPSNEENRTTPNSPAKE